MNSGFHSSLPELGQVIGLARKMGANQKTV
jgi:hypothetical protein